MPIDDRTAHQARMATGFPAILHGSLNMARGKRQDADSQTHKDIDAFWQIIRENGPFETAFDAELAIRNLVGVPEGETPLLTPENAFIVSGNGWFDWSFPQSHVNDIYENAFHDMDTWIRDITETQDPPDALISFVKSLRTELRSFSPT